MHGQDQNSNGFGLLVSVFVFSVFVNLLMLTGPLFMLQIYDRVLGSGSQATLVALFLLVTGLYAMMAVLDYARGRLMSRYAVRLRLRYDQQIFRAMLTRPKDGTASTGLRDLDAVQSCLSAPVMIAFFDIPWTPVFLMAIFVFHPLLGWLALAGGLILVLASLMNNWLTAPNTLRALQFSRSAHVFSEQTRLSGGFIHRQNMGRAMTDRWQSIQTNALMQHIKAGDRTGWFTAFTKAFRLFLQSAMLALGAWLALIGELSAGAMIAGSILLGRALAPIEQSMGQWNLFQKGYSAWCNVRAIIEQGPGGPPSMHLPKPAATMTLKGVSVFAPSALKPTLSGISFALDEGQVLGVIGNSGMGKSTLAKALVGLLPPATGDIRLDGATLDQYDPDQLGQLIGYLPQSVSLFDGTIAENIARMAVEPDNAAVFEAAKRANAHDMILSLPQGYQTALSGYDDPLSGGQRQRIALARALYGDPLVLVLDEPSSALDSLGTDALNQTIRSFRAEKKAVVIMTHRPQAINECDRLIVIEHGRIKAIGPRDEVLELMVQNPSNGAAPEAGETNAA